jgi:hypothetical protein
MAAVRKFAPSSGQSNQGLHLRWGEGWGVQNREKFSRLLFCLKNGAKKWRERKKKKKMANFVLFELWFLT